MMDMKERFEQKIETVPESGCWIWTAGCDGGGYGAFVLNGKVERAHRVAYKIYIGPIPEGMYVLHKCDVTVCVNPEHLFTGTQKDNMDDKNRKGRNHFSNKTHCKYGHEFNLENTYIFPGSGRRSCRTCMKRWARARRERSRGSPI